MIKKNVIAIPPYYEGTSFQDIVGGLALAAKNFPVPIKFVGYQHPLPNNLSIGFLDDMNYNKGQQQLLGKLILEKDLEKVLFLDFFNPGLDLLRYFHEQQNKKVKYGSLLHGGTFLSNDLYSYGWLRGFERAWFSVYDSIYVPSKFLAKSCPRSAKNKLGIFPWGMDSFKWWKSSNRKKWDVVFPHRLDYDKGADEFVKIVKLLPDISFIITVPQPLSVLKENKYFRLMRNCKNVTFRASNLGRDHFDVLSKSRILLSCSKQETFGYSVMKGVLAGCIPVLPKRLCYPEFFDKKFLYSNSEQCAYLIKKYIYERGDSIIFKKMAIDREKIRSFSFVEILRDFFGK